MKKIELKDEFEESARPGINNDDDWFILILVAEWKAKELIIWIYCLALEISGNSKNNNEMKKWWMTERRKNMEKCEQKMKKEREISEKMPDDENWKNQ